MQALMETCSMLRTVFTDAIWNIRQMADVITVRDFNCYDWLWGGDDISWVRQGEADNIIDLMDEMALGACFCEALKPNIEENLSQPLI